MQPGTSKKLGTLALWGGLILLFILIYRLLGGSSSGRSAGRTDADTWLAFLLVFVVLVALFVVALRRVANRSGTGMLSLRNTTARLLSARPTTRFGDVGGAAHAKEQLADVVDFLRQPDRWLQAGARLPRGVLLEGPPGCGKTLLARALAGEASAAFFEVSATEFVELFVGVGAARVRDLFESAAKKAPSILFIDELDAIGRRRGAGAVGIAHQEREHTLNQLLVSMDGFGQKARVVVVAATNRADVLDPALLRAGRFDVRIAFSPLTLEERMEVLSIHGRGKPIAPGLDVAELASLADGFTGSDLEHLCNHAALKATRRARLENGRAAELTMDDFTAVISERAGRESRFDKLDAALIESASQLSQPTGRVLVRVSLEDGSLLEGELVWADSAFVKIREPRGTTVLVSKQQIRKLEATAGTDRHHGEVVPDSWVGQRPDAG